MEQNPEGTWPKVRSNAVDYAIVIEKGKESYGGYPLDIDGIYAFGDSEAEVKEKLSKAVTDRIAELRAEGKEIPAPSHTIGSVRLR